MKLNKTSHVFMSYSQQDSAVALRVQTTLLQMGLNVWIDQAQIKPGDSFLEKMNEGLGSASYVLLLCSPESLRSRWVTREWMSSLARQDTVLVPIKIAPVEMPPLLTDILYIDLTKDFETGMNRLIKFLHDEQATPDELRPRVVFRTDSIDHGLPDPPDPEVSGSAPLSLCRAELHEIRKVAKRCVDSVALKEYIFDLDIEEGSLKGESLHEQLINLLHTLNRDGQLIHFATWLEAERKNCVQLHLTKLRAASG